MEIFFSLIYAPSIILYLPKIIKDYSLCVNEFSFGEGLDRLRLFSEQQRKLGGDMKEAYKIMGGIDRMENQYLSPIAKGIKNKMA